MVGRADELARVVSCLRHRSVSGVVVAGLAGVGKTRFAAEALTSARAAGCVTAWATATQAAATIPFGAVAHLLPVPGLDAAGRLQVLVRAGSALREGADGRRLVLCVDDAHLLDEGSAALVYQLASTAEAFVLVTVRTGAGAPDPILGLWKDGLAEYLELGPLPRAQATALVAHALGDALDEATALALWEVTRGNVLFVHELVLDGLEAGVLTREVDVWRWSGSMRAGGRVGEIVRARIGKLSEAERSALELVAFGEPIGVAVVEPLVAEEVLEDLARRGLMTLEPLGRRWDARLAHPLYGEVLRGQAPAPRALAGRLADALDATGARRREDLLRLASWRLTAGAPGPPELLVAAAWRALASFDPRLAERLGAAVIDGGGFEARYVSALAVGMQGRFDDADTLFAGLALDAADDSERMRVADVRAANLYWGMGRGEEAERVLLKAEDDLGEGDPADELAAIRAALLAFSGRPGEALALTRPILGRAGVADRTRVRAGMAAVTALALIGGADAAQPLVAELRGAALGVGEELPFAPAQLLGAYALALILAGRLTEARREVEPGHAQALEQHALAPAALWGMMLGRFDLAQGALGHATTHLQQAAAVYAKVDTVGFGAACLAFLAQTRGQAGDPAAAAQALERAEAVLRPGFRIFDADLGLARAWSAAAGGDLPAARDHARHVAQTADANGHLAYAALAWHELARLGEARSASEPLGALVSRVDGPLVGAFAAHTAALAANDGAALDAAAARFEALEAQLLSAEAFAEASAAHRTCGRAASAARSATRARALIERCGGPATPALIGLGAAAALTGREREVASLAAGGLSNRQIAARLVLSARTVEHHLEHAYQKLGVSRRAELAEHLGGATPEG
ncbi:MAG TPA: LuxR C-terminal-related transcriptional regulator [Solirubrobacteraceae bacterium]